MPLESDLILAVHQNRLKEADKMLSKHCCSIEERRHLLQRAIAEKLNHIFCTLDEKEAASALKAVRHFKLQGALDPLKPDALQLCRKFFAGGNFACAQELWKGFEIETEQALLQEIKTAGQEGFTASLEQGEYRTAERYRSFFGITQETVQRAVRETLFLFLTDGAFGEQQALCRHFAVSEQELLDIQQQALQHCLRHGSHATAQEIVHALEKAA